MARRRARTTTPAARRTTTAASRRATATQRICNLVPSRDIERDWKFTDALSAGVLGAVAALPSAVDLRKAWWGVGDQGQTGSCVGWATAEGVMRYHMVAAGKLQKNEQMSPRYVWMASKETDEYAQRPETFIEEAGTSLKAAMNVCKKYGAVTMSLLPFQIATTMYTASENTFYAEAAKRRIASYFNLYKNLDQWKAWLAAHGPILAGLSVDHTWDNATATHGNLDSFLPNTVRGGHAITVVGYVPNGRFIIRNSWGTAWGDKGFAYATPAYIAAGFFNESYGVTA